MSALELSKEEFSLLRDFVQEHSGIAVGDEKSYLIETRLANLVVFLGDRVAAGDGVRGRGLAEHRLGNLRVQVIGQLLEEVHAAAYLGLYELDHHALGHDRGGVGAQVAHGA